MLEEKKGKREGFVIIVALIISVIVLTVGIGIISITLKDYLFSGIVSESHKAFYAADTGLDCAFYYDLRNGFSTEPPFPTPPPATGPDTFPQTFTPVAINCGGQSITPTISCNNGTGTTRYCQVLFDTLSSGSDALCFKVSVTYNLNHQGTAADLDDDREGVIFQSRGYNTCDTTNPRRLERALELRYGQSS